MDDDLREAIARLENACAFREAGARREAARTAGLGGSDEERLREAMSDATVSVLANDLRAALDTLTALAAKDAFRQEVIDAINGMERSCIFWCNKAWYGHIPGDARDARRMLGGRFDELRETIGIGPLPQVDGAAADDIGYHPGDYVDCAAKDARIRELTEALERIVKRSWDADGSGQADTETGYYRDGLREQAGIARSTLHSQGEGG